MGSAVPTALSRLSKLNTFTSARLSSGDEVSWQVIGTPADDELLAGGTAGTTFDALAGDDTFAGSFSADVFNGGSGTDRSLQMLIANW